MNAIQNLTNQKPTTDSNVHLNEIHVSNLLELSNFVTKQNSNWSFLFLTDQHKPKQLQKL